MNLFQRHPFSRCLNYPVLFFRKFTIAPGLFPIFFPAGWRNTRRSCPTGCLQVLFLLASSGIRLALRALQGPPDRCGSHEPPARNQHGSEHLRLNDSPSTSNLQSTRRNIFKTVQTAENETVEAQSKLNSNPSCRCFLNPTANRRKNPPKTPNHQQPTCAPHLNTSLMLTHLQ